ncbi:MAG: retropepsin-like aspartic protease family protein [Paracoccaceae bacterium]
MDTNQLMNLLYLGLLLASVGGWVMVEYRKRMGQALRVALAWGMIFVGVMAGYGLWNDLRRDFAPRQMVTDTGTLMIPRANDGHYYLTLQVNGQEVKFMADTGASNVVLSQDDARTLGIDPGSLAYVGEAMTANGVVRTARVRLPEVTLGPFTDTEVPAYVTQGEMDISLLGMDFLGQFNIAINQGTMVLSR